MVCAAGRAEHGRASLLGFVAHDGHLLGLWRDATGLHVGPVFGALGGYESGANDANILNVDHVHDVLNHWGLSYRDGGEGVGPGRTNRLLVYRQVRVWL